MSAHRRLRPPVPVFISRQTVAAEYFFLGPQREDSADLNVVCGGMETCASDYLVDRQSLPYHTLEFIVRGRCEVRLQRQLFSAGAGAVFYYGPSMPHRIKNTGEGPLVKFFVCIEGLLADGLLGECFDGSVCPLQVAEYRWIHDLFRLLQDCGQRESATTRDSCRQIVRLLLDRIRGLATETGHACSKALMTFQSCRAYISQHYASIRSVTEVARHCQVHRAYLPQLFMRFAQTTPSQLIHQYRMNEAARLLRQGGLLVKEVAAQVGFDDPLHFSRSFKKYYGLSPRKFMQQSRGSHLGVPGAGGEAVPYPCQQASGD